MRLISEYTVDELKNLIANHERLGKTDEPLYEAALSELQARNTSDLDIDRSMVAIMASARTRSFISYGDVARANGLEWSYALNRLMPKHLDLILAKANARGIPLITSIVVNRDKLATGDLDPTSLKGFVAGARRLGRQVDDERAFLREQQEKTFEYAAGTGARQPAGADQ